MPDTQPDEAYSLPMRAVALLGLFLVGAVAFILLDIASGGKLTGDCQDCKGSGDAAD